MLKVLYFLINSICRLSDFAYYFHQQNTVSHYLDNPGTSKSFKATTIEAYYTTRDPVKTGIASAIMQLI